MNNFSFSEVLDRAWELSKKHGIVIAVILFVVIAAVNTLSYFITPADATEAYLKAVQHGKQLNPMMVAEIYQSSFICSIIQTIIFTGLYAAVMAIVKGTSTTVTFDHWKLPLAVYAKYVGATIVYGIIVFIGICCCILPGIFLAIRLQYAPLAIIDNHECGFVEAFKISWNITSGHFMTLLGIVFAMLIAALVGLLCCFVGVFFAYAFIIFASVVSYQMLKNTDVMI